VLEQIHHEITVEAAAEYAARTEDALLEARRTSGSGKPWWEPSPPSVLAHAREAGGSAGVMKVEPLFQRDAQKVEALWAIGPTSHSQWESWARLLEAVKTLYRQRMTFFSQP
jgi:hypothetical protein